MTVRQRSTVLWRDISSRWTELQLPESIADNPSSVVLASGSEDSQADRTSSRNCAREAIESQRL